MKKLLSLLLAVCMCFFACFVLAACGAEEHTHTYKTEWSKDSTHHWHACEGEACNDIADKAEHIWDEGEITTEATAEKEGEVTYKCTVCTAVKGEAVEYTGVSENNWNEMLAAPNFENYTFSYGGTVTSCDSTNRILVTDQHYTVKILSDSVVIHGNVTFPNGEEADQIIDMVLTGEDAARQKNAQEAIFLSFLAEYANYQYNSEENVYELHTPIELSIDFGGGVPITVNLSNCKATISNDGKLQTLVCDYSQTRSDQYTAKSVLTYTFFDYGNTTVDDAD